jgi:hypothetical protein
VSTETSSGPAVVNALTRHRMMCVEHAHRPATDRCDVCHRPFCADCFVKGGEQLVCRECRTTGLKQAAAEREQRRLRTRLGAAFRTYATHPFVILGSIVVLVLAGVAAAATMDRGPKSAGTAGDGQAIMEGVKNLQQAQQDFGDFGAEQQRLDCARRTGQDCPEFRPTPAIRAKPQTIVAVREVTAAFAGGIADPSGQFAARNLLANDGPTTPGWRTAGSALPQELTFQFQSIGLVDHAAFRLSQASPPASWAKDVELLLSPSASGPYTSVGTWTLRQTTDPQQFTFVPRQAGYARLRIVSRYGDSSYTALGAVAFGIATGDPGALLAT